MYKTLFKNTVSDQLAEEYKELKNSFSDDAYSLKIKNFIDFFVALTFLLIIASWLFPVIAMIIKSGSKGPVFFQQLRHGKDNMPFYCFKFRSMVMNDEADTVQAKKGDHRITKFGAFLRKSSIDELPQLINVLRGEMSLIGPRPHAVPMNEIFSDKIYGYMDRHAIKPGLTGLAQSRGFRGEIRDFQDLYFRYKMDMFYLKKWNLFFDVKILVWTGYMILFNNKNAY